jgi:hypothetical protein
VAAVSSDAADGAERESISATNFWSSSFLERHSFNLFANGLSQSLRQWFIIEISEKMSIHFFFATCKGSQPLQAVSQEVQHR